mmetsp:Transcript_934/g.2596  ORF Transcript_934/g.2596 Transcript_934/m.2596 type:complete len:268 (+) Transcript_934:576-1379(+)
MVPVHAREACHHALHCLTIHVKELAQAAHVHHGRVHGHAQGCCLLLQGHVIESVPSHGHSESSGHEVAHVGRVELGVRALILRGHVHREELDLHVVCHLAEQAAAQFPEGGTRLCPAWVKVAVRVPENNRLHRDARSKRAKFKLDKRLAVGGSALWKDAHRRPGRVGLGTRANGLSHVRSARGRPSIHRYDVVGLGDAPQQERVCILGGSHKGHFHPRSKEEGLHEGHVIAHHDGRAPGGRWATTHGDVVVAKAEENRAHDGGQWGH